MKKNLILTLILTLLSSGLFAQQVIERSGMRILNLKRSTNNGQANNFEFKISDNLNGVNVLAPRSLSIVANQNAADIALLANPSQRNPQFILKSNGNVGIGTNNPTAKLHVNGQMLVRNPVGAAITIRSAESSAQFIEYRATNNIPVARLGTNIDNNFYISYFGGGGIRIVGSTNFSSSTSFSRNISVNGNVGIGTSNPTDRLTVAGNIRAREVRVTANAGADFVFEKDYALRPLLEVETFIQKNKHLPEIAPAAKMVKEGVNTGAFQIQLLQKIEELTLYVIAQEKRIAALEAENKLLKTSN